jgi:hypothetical protein
MGNPCIDPSDRIRDIRAIDRNIVSDEKIFSDILLNPLAVSSFLFNRPSAIPNRPDLIRGFLCRMTERDHGNQEEKQDEKKHTSSLKDGWRVVNPDEMRYFLLK